MHVYTQKLKAKELWKNGCKSDNKPATLTREKPSNNRH